MRIGELALRTGASTRALRHYEARALIASSRLENGYRDYAPAMVQRVRWIRELIECGFSTRQIHGLLQHLEEEEDSEGFLACLQQHLEKLQALDALQAENRRLQKELRRAVQQRDILKKTLGIISAPSENDLGA